LDIKTKRDAKLFDKYLSEFQRRNEAPPLDFLSIESVFCFLQGQNNQGRLFTYMIDLQIQFALLNIDSCKMDQLDRDIRDVENFSGPEIFCNRTALLKTNSDYIFRYRALWDKIMGCIVLIVEPSKFQKLFKSNSRKKDFKKIVAGHPKFPDSLLDHIIETTTKFDNLYRTAEAHMNGSTRQWSYDYSESPFSDQANMKWAWNAMIPIIEQIGKFFKDGCEYIKSEPK
jgi:hypothetical protein